MDPCRHESNGVYQSPIALSKCASIYLSDPKLELICDQIKGVFDPQTRNWNVINDVFVRNNDSEYRLNEFHFHFPGEHTINGEKFICELHLVFTNSTSIFVIGFVIEESNKSSKIIRRIVKNRPFRIPVVESYFTYPGSLTTPPFNVNVNWNVSSEQLKISKCDLALIAKLSKMERPLQPRNGRNIILAK